MTRCDLWVAPVESPLALASLLTEAEAEHCASRGIGAARHATSRALLALLAHEYGGDDHQTLRTAHRCPRCGASDHGRPALLGGPQVSISRTDAVVVALAGAMPCGVDAELLGGRSAGLQALREHVLSGDEQARLADEDTAIAEQTMLAYWTRKEAVLKCDGVGLRLAPSTVSTHRDEATLAGRRYALETLLLRDRGLLVSIATSEPLVALTVSVVRVSTGVRLSSLDPVRLAGPRFDRGISTGASLTAGVGTTP